MIWTPLGLVSLGDKAPLNCACITRDIGSPSNMHPLFNPMKWFQRHVATFVVSRPPFYCGLAVLSPYIAVSIAILVTSSDCRWEGRGLATESRRPALS